MRKCSKGSIGLTNSSPWRQNRNVVCHLGSPFCQTPQLMLGPEHLVRNVLIEKHTLTPKVGQRERSIFSPLSLIGPQSLQNKGSKLLDKYWMALPKGTMTSQLKNPAVKKIYIYLQQHINTVSLISMYKFELSRFLKMWQELMNCSSKAVKSSFILIPKHLHCSVWKIHSNKITMRWYFDVRSTKPVSI